MKYFKQHMTTLAVASLLMSVTVPSQAVFTSVQKAAPITAQAQLVGAGSISITNVVVRNISNNQTPNPAQLGWSNVTLPTSWKVSDQYIELDTQMTTGPGGVQIYTDNTNASASPKYTGTIDANHQSPAGLVEQQDTTQKLPTAWRASTYTLTAVNAIDPNAASGESYLWFFHEDKAQVANANLNVTLFANADPYVTVYGAPGFAGASGGPHYAQDPAGGPYNFSGFQTNAATYIYTEANFTTALTPRTYGTSELILEAFTD